MLLTFRIWYLNEGGKLKEILDSGIHVLDSAVDSGFLELYSGFQIPAYRKKLKGKCQQFKDVRIASIRRISLIRNSKSLHVRWMRLAALCLDGKHISFLFFSFHGFLDIWRFWWMVCHCLTIPYKCEMKARNTQFSHYVSKRNKDALFSLLYSSTNHILFLYLHYFKYCDRLFYSRLAVCLVEILDK